MEGFLEGRVWGWGCLFLGWCGGRSGSGGSCDRRSGWVKLRVLHIDWYCEVVVLLCRSGWMMKWMDVGESSSLSSRMERLACTS